ICGITRVEDALTAVALGVDAIGLVFYPKSPRYVSIPQAQAICQVLPPFVTCVGLFLNASATDIQNVIDQVPLNLLQFHGDESPADCDGFSLSYIKAIPMAGEVDMLAYAAAYPNASGFLVDSHVAGEQGGSGEVFDWNKIPKDLGFPLILAGGLNSDNVADAITQVKPYAVDVSSGVEKDKGIKDPEKMALFMNAVNVCKR
ncbi:MAG: phosphoribosylanthranilate isomerase, partial [Gammaproteobacteria bacterium]|nr:phosphoribosylanthranilate isomerase [Gammaproteobacteria bacterium]